MQRTVVVIVGVAALAVAGAVLLFVRPDPTGMAVGRLAPAERELHLKLWHALEPTGPLYLREWSAELADPPDDPLQLAEAFNELAYAVTGPTGLWRKTVPNEMFGCKADPDTPVCQRLVEVATSFARWDRLQERLAKLDNPTEARRVLRQEAPALEEYVRTLVPRERGLEGLQATPFFAEHVAPVLP